MDLEVFLETIKAKKSEEIGNAIKEVSVSKHKPLEKYLFVVACGAELEGRVDDGLARTSESLARTSKAVSMTLGSLAQASDELTLAGGNLRDAKSKLSQAGEQATVKAGEELTVKKRLFFGAPFFLFFSLLFWGAMFGSPIAIFLGGFWTLGYFAWLASL